MWGEQPFIPTGPVSGSNEFGGGNNFNSGKIAMAITHAWYMCCVGDLVSAGGEFQFGALPSYNGTVYGRVDADTYRIMKSTEHPEEAFTVLTYLITEAAVKLSTVYGGLPAITSMQDAWLNAKKKQFPFVTTWDTLLAGLGYADVPSAEGYLPNGIEANNRIGTFISLISTDNTVDLAAEIQKLQDDLQVIYDKK
jgi:multiple sugar transport system substrate-binding protein